MGESEYLGRDDIIRASDTDMVTVDVPEWGGRVRVRTLSGKDRDQLMADTQAGRLTNWHARFAGLVMANADGTRMFDDKDVDVLGLKSAAALERVVQAGLKLNGMDPDAVDELEKN